MTCQRINQPHRCEVCGSQVRVASSDDGRVSTNHYEPVAEKVLRRVYRYFVERGSFEAQSAVEWIAYMEGLEIEEADQ